MFEGLSNPQNHEASAESILREIEASISDLERQFRQELPVKPSLLLESIVTHRTTRLRTQFSSRYALLH